MARGGDEEAPEVHKPDGQRHERNERVRRGAAHDAENHDDQHGDAQKVGHGHREQLVHQALVLGEAVQDAAVGVVHKELRRRAHDGLEHGCKDAPGRRERDLARGAPPRVQRRCPRQPSAHHTETLSRATFAMPYAVVVDAGHDAGQDGEPDEAAVDAHVLLQRRVGVVAPVREEPVRHDRRQVGDDNGELRRRPTRSRMWGPRGEQGERRTRGTNPSALTAELTKMGTKTQRPPRPPA